MYKLRNVNVKNNHPDTYPVELLTLRNVNALYPHNMAS